MSELSADQIYQTAVLHHRAGRLAEAESLYRQILAAHPRHFGAMHHLGVIAHQTGHNEFAVEQIQRAIAIDSSSAEAHNNLGVIFKDMGQFDRAIAAFRQAVARQTGSAMAMANLGGALRQQGSTDNAIAASRQAIALDPNCAQAHNNLGAALEDKDQLDDAIAAFTQAIALNPAYAEAHNNLGNVLWHVGRLEEAIAAYRRAATLLPGYFQAHSNLIYAMHFHPGCDAHALAAEQRAWNERHAKPLQKFIQPHLNDRSPDRRLRIGYVSPNFRDHPIGRFLLPLLTHHDRNQVESFAYSHARGADETARRLASLVDNWRNIASLSDEQAAELIRADKIDILVDLSMHMADNRLLLFARKPAPVQVSYLAYCSSTGLAAMDYRLSDPYLDPPAQDQSIYSERTITLPETYWCYQPPLSDSPIKPSPASSNGFVTFANLNNFAKVNEPMLSGWAKILRAVPESRLVLHARPGHHREHALKHLAQQGIDRKRVHFEGFMPMQKYLELYEQIDIALDTLPYGGGTTTCDALWMGVPVISQRGSTAVGRGGVSILSNIGLPQLLARSQDEYVQIAIDLAKDAARLANLHSTLRARLEQSPLMNAPRFAQNVEAAYRTMWRTSCMREF